MSNLKDKEKDKKKSLNPTAQEQAFLCCEPDAEKYLNTPLSQFDSNFLESVKAFPVQHLVYPKNRILFLSVYPSSSVMVFRMTDAQKTLFFGFRFPDELQSDCQKFSGKPNLDQNDWNSFFNILAERISERKWGLKKPQTDQQSQFIKIEMSDNFSIKIPLKKAAFSTPVMCYTVTQLYYELEKSNVAKGAKPQALPMPVPVQADADDGEKNDDDEKEEEPKHPKPVVEEEVLAKIPAPQPKMEEEKKDFIPSSSQSPLPSNSALEEAKRRMGRKSSLSGSGVVGDSPAKRGLDYLKKLRQKTEDEKEQMEVDFLLYHIEKQSLFEVNVDQIVDQEKDQEIKAWIQSNLTQRPSTKVYIKMIKGYIRAMKFANALVSQSEKSEVKTHDPYDIDIPENVSAYLEKNGFEYNNPDGFNIFELHEMTGGRSLTFMGLWFLSKFGIIQKYNLSVSTLKAFFSRIENGYKDNPYHNKIHAADVLQTVCCFLKGQRIAEIFSPLEIFGAIIAAIIHDYKHPGVNNAFEIKSSTPRALLFSDQSVLEMFHLAQVFRLLKDENYDIFGTLADKEKNYVRDIMISMVLATDMGKHFDFIARVKNGIMREFIKEKREHVFDLLGLIIKSADVSNPTKNLKLCIPWAERVMSEFYLQGDKEKEKGFLEISPLCNRATSNIPQAQIGFVQYICLPLFSILTDFDKSFGYIIDTVKTNLKYWEEKKKEAEEKVAQAAVAAATD